MIKVTFKEIQSVYDKELDMPTECLFLLCKVFAIGGEIKYKSSICFDYAMLDLNSFSNIKSIEHVKPTDL